MSFDKAFNSVRKLVKDFDAFKERYMKPDYSEPQARLDFIDKYFVALGWDVNHETQTNPYKQEVKVEKNVNTGHSQRRADYAFYIAPNYQDVKYYVEAKKPSVDIESKDSYFQIIRYGWNSQTPIGILTDFEQFHIVDCRYRPNIETALDRGLKKFYYTDYLNKDKFAKIYYLFSREAVEEGSIEDYTASLPKRKGRGVQKGFFRTGFQNIDESFLADLDSYRVTLARIFKKADHSLDGLSLTEITQRTLDRLVFLRFLEDKLIETHYRIASFGDSGSSWRDFIATCKKLDDIYNGIIFKRHSLLDSPDLNVEDNDFTTICKELSHTYTPYDFNHIPIHILGSIYERFLGKVIVSTAKRAKVEEKPEVRKAGGVYYTPEYIVRYIVEHTIGKLISGKSPPEIAKMNFIDISCGSGSFLLGMYQYLLDYHRQWYNDNPKKAKKTDCFKHEDGTLHLMLEKKREILLNNIYGVDIDFQAVEVSQLSLYLKMLEEETTESANLFLSFEQEHRRKQLLPPLDDNIKSGNSLIGHDFYGGSQGDLFNHEETRRINAFDWQTGFPEVFKGTNPGFDAVIGNPPYIDSELMTVYLPDLRNYCITRYKAASGNWDIFCVFIEKAINLCKKKGLASYIVPNKLASANYAAGARYVLANQNRLISIRDYSDVKVFPVSVYPIVYVAQKAPSHPNFEVQYEHMEHLESKVIDCLKSHGLNYKRYFSKEDQPWHMFTSHDKSNPIERLLSTFPSLDTVAQVLGAATVSEAYEIKSLIEESDKKHVSDLRVANTGTIDRYHLLWGEKRLRYLGNSFLRPIIPANRVNKLPIKRKEQAESKKIIVAGMSKILECSIDNIGSFLAGKSTSIIFSSSLDLRYLLSLLNSKLITFCYWNMFGGNKLQGGYYRIGPPQLRLLPVPTINFSNKHEKAQHDKIVKLVDQMLDLNIEILNAKSEQSKSIIQRRIDAIDQQIDSLVYKLYDLTDAEINVVEKSVQF